MKIYTRTGDTGVTSLYSERRVPKNHPLIEAIGAVDEANSSVGLALSLLPKQEETATLREELTNVQHTLFDVGAALATPRGSQETRKVERTRFDGEAIADIEGSIDVMDKELPPLRAFILPSGHPSAAALHVARTLVRRAERWVVSLYEEESIAKEVLAYLNRLSDYLFMAARLINHRLGLVETKWTKR